MDMILLLLAHILIALSSLAAATLAVFTPTSSKVRLSYGLTVATIATGSILVIATHSPLLSSCLAGLAYTSLALALIISAKRRLAKDRISG